MKIKKRILWQLFSISGDEALFTMPLFALYFFSGTFYTIGQIYSESLFIKTYGAKGFSVFFMQNGIALIIAGVLYNYFFLRISFRKGYYILIAFAASLIASSAFISDKSPASFPMYLYMGNYIFTFFLDIHFFNYAFSFLNIRNSKRIIPFVMSGGKLGGIVISLAIYAAIRDEIVDHGLYIWCANALILALVVALSGIKTGKKNEVAGSLRPDKKTAREDFIKKTKLIFSSKIFIYSVAAVFIMSVINQISEYYYALSFSSRFQTKEELASFLSIYTFCSDLVTLMIQIALSSRIIRMIGVTSSNLIYPSSFIIFMAAFIASPGLAAGTALRFFRKNMGPVIRTPVFNIIMAASPRESMAEIKSFISAIIAPLGMIAGGSIILFISSMKNHNAGFIITISLALLYLILSYFQNRAYVNSLKKRLAFDFNDRYSPGISIKDYEPVLSDEKYYTAERIGIVEDIFIKYPGIYSISFMAPHFHRFSVIVRKEIISVLKTENFENESELLLKALNDSSPEVRCEALSVISFKDYNRRKDLISRSAAGGLLYGEKIAIAVLIDKKYSHEVSERISDTFTIKKIEEIKNGVSDGTREDVEFTTIASLVRPEYFIKDLYDLSLSTGREIYFKAAIEHASYLSRSQSVKLLYRFRQKNINLVASFAIAAEKLENTDRLMILEWCKNIPESAMSRIFRYITDRKSSDIIARRLFRDTDFYKKSNYLGFLMANNMRPVEQLSRFIELEISIASELIRSSGIISSVNTMPGTKPDIYVKYMIILLNYTVELHKQLIIKAIAASTGANIDDAYEANILLKDRDMNAIILEYLESTGSISRKASALIDPPSFHNKTYHVSTPSEGMRALNTSLSLIKNFVPGIPVPGRLEFEERIKLVLKSEERKTMELMEKSVFLRNTEIFSELGLDELVHLAGVSGVRELHGGEMLIKKGDNESELYIIVDGEVEIFTEKKTITTLGPGSCIGELSIIDSMLRSANVRTTKKSKFISLSRKDFILTLKENPAISINVMKILTQRLRKSLSAEQV